MDKTELMTEIKKVQDEYSRVHILNDCKQYPSEIEKNLHTRLDMLADLLQKYFSTDTDEKRFVVIGRRWFEKTNGNTYHSVSLINARTGANITRNTFTYGYGDQFIHSAKEMAVKLELVPADISYGSFRDMCIYSVSDVANKRDL